jgi:hypothetical protein
MIRPNNCAFKDTFFGSNPFEFNSGAVKIGSHAQDFTRCGDTKQSEIARSGSGRQSPQVISDALPFGRLWYAEPNAALP